jgi:hypothetical protein
MSRFIISIIISSRVISRVIGRAIGIVCSNISMVRGLCIETKEG